MVIKKKYVTYYYCLEKTAIVISVKHYNSCHPDFDRFNRNVIKKSSRQLHGAYRKLFANEEEVSISHPKRGIEKFDKDRFKNIHLITVNTGTRFEYYQHSDSESGKRLINILDSNVFSAIINELDTVSDLVKYFNERESIFNKITDSRIRCDERDFLATYLMNNRKFPGKFYSGDILKESESVIGNWKDYLMNKSNIIKKMYDEKSYFIDSIVENNILNDKNGELLGS